MCILNGARSHELRPRPAYFYDSFYSAFMPVAASNAGSS